MPIPKSCASTSPVNRRGFRGSSASWDIFCAVVDNYGDIGVCWRLARQLAVEHGIAARLWVDDLDSFARLCPTANTEAAVQQLGGVEVRCWDETFPQDIEPADVVIEAFACELPPTYLVGMASRLRKPVWINLEYLSAEAWVEGCHRMASPHPRLPLVKHFFFPGFTSATGGLLRERDLLAHRAAFCAAPQARTAFWQEVGFAAPDDDLLCVSLFAYRESDVRGLLSAFAACGRRILCAIPDGPLLDEAAAQVGRPALQPGEEVRMGDLTVRVLPFVEQSRYDALLWSCDVNFVRGEDSFVRSQWAARPLVWQIYAQADDVHLRKLDAFLGRYCEGLDGDSAGALGSLMRAWNSGERLDAPWRAFLDNLSALRRHAGHWADGQAAHADLASALVEFADTQL